MEAQHGDAPAIFHRRIEIHVVLVAGQHFAEAAHADERARMIAHRLLERAAEARRVPRAVGEDREAAAALEAVAADEARLLVVEIAEARDVESARLADRKSQRLK